MAVTPKKVNGRWKVDFFPDGRYGPRVRKTFDRKIDAERFITQEKSKSLEVETYRAPQKDHRRLSDLSQAWYDLYGHSLKDGERRLKSLMRTCKKLGNPLATKFTSQHWMEYRKARSEEINPHTKRPISLNTINHEHRYLSAVFFKLSKLNNWKGANPMNGLDTFRISDPGLTYLTDKQIVQLLNECRESKSEVLYPYVRLCLATGARWGEVGSLSPLQLRDGKVHYVNTKNTNARAIPIPEDLAAEVLSFRSNNGKLFSNPKRGFEQALERAGIELPIGQKTHVLRHTYASHFVINGGDILRLSKILGHKDVQMTLRYAKLAPEHLEDSLRLNPLANLKGEHKVSTKCLQKGSSQPRNES